MMEADVWVSVTVLARSERLNDKPAVDEATLTVMGDDETPLPPIRCHDVPSDLNSAVDFGVIMKIFDPSIRSVEFPVTVTL
jgi:hypothetical protein